MGIDISFDNISQDNLYLILIFDTFVEAKAELYIYAVFYIPSRMSPIQINLVVDLRGTVSDGRSGIKLEFSFMEQKFDLNVYFVLNIFKFDFYFKYCIYINLPFTKYNKEFYIFYYQYKGILIKSNNLKKLEMNKGKFVNQK